MRGKKIRQKGNWKRRIVAVGLVLILIFALVQYSMLMSNRTHKQYELRLEETSQQIADGVRRHIDSSLSFLNGMSEVFAQYDDIHSEEALALLAKVSKQSDFKRMWLTKADGTAKSSEGKDSDAIGRDYFDAALRGESGVSAIQFSKVNGERNVVIYAPIYHNETITGMVIGIYALDELSEIINIECFGGSGYSHIVTKDGEIVTLSKHADVNQDNQKKIKYWEEYGYSCPVGINDWYIFITLPEAVVNDTLRYNFMVSLIIWVELAFVLVVVVYDRYKIKNQELRKLAQTDSMTALYNRGTVEETINYILMNEEESCSFLLFDVDHFKEVNDTLGHMAGDELLCKIAAIMNDEFRKIDILGRLGGDEFLVFMRGTADSEIVKKKVTIFMERIHSISKELEWDKEITISVGIAISPTDGIDFETLYKAADAKMYEAKKENGNSMVGI